MGLQKALLNASNNLDPGTVDGLDAVTARLLMSALYETLTRDDAIRALLVNVIQERGTPQAQVLFDALVQRTRENYNKITHQ